MDFNNTFINDSESYMAFTSLFEDIEHLNKLAKQRIEENNPLAALRCISMTKNVIDELKLYILK